MTIPAHFLYRQRSVHPTPKSRGLAQTGPDLTDFAHCRSAATLRCGSLVSVLWWRATPQEYYFGKNCHTPLDRAGAEPRWCSDSEQGLHGLSTARGRFRGFSFEVVNRFISQLDSATSSTSSSDSAIRALPGVVKLIRPSFLFNEISSI